MFKFEVFSFLKIKAMCCCFFPLQIIIIIILNFASVLKYRKKSKRLSSKTGFVLSLVGQFKNKLGGGLFPKVMQFTVFSLLKRETCPRGDSGSQAGCTGGLGLCSSEGEWVLGLCCFPALSGPGQTAPNCRMSDRARQAPVAAVVTGGRGNYM